jgi:hypothetical protein
MMGMDETPIEPSVYEFDSAKLLYAIAYHLIDEGVTEIDPDTYWEQYCRLRANNTVGRISARTWRNLRDLARLYWLLKRANVEVDVDELGRAEFGEFNESAVNEDEGQYE